MFGIPTVRKAKAAARASASGVDQALIGCRLEDAASGNSELGPVRHKNTSDVDFAYVEFLPGPGILA